MGEVWEYLWAFWPTWWALFSAGFLFGLDEVLSQRWPKGKAWLDRRLSQSTRRIIEYVLIVVAMLYAGFAAWQIEHRGRLEAEAKVKSPSSVRVLTGQARSVLAANRETILGWKHRLFIYTASDGDSYDYGFQFYEQLASLGAPAYLLS